MSAERQPENLIMHKVTKADIPRLDFIVAGMGKTKALGYFGRQLDYQAKGHREVYLITVDGVDAGYCILNWDPKYGFFRKMGVPEIQDINVTQQFRRQGVATAMIEYCEDLAREKDKAYMGIGVSVSSDFGPAQRLYTKLGYIPDGHGVTYDRQNTSSGDFKPIDDQLCLMMVKAL